MDVLSGLTAAKQAYDLLKVIKDAHDEGVIAKAVGDLHHKITELQMLNAELSGLYQAEREVAMKLREEKTKIEMFTVNSSNYELYTSDGGSTVYRSKASSDGVVQHHYLCTHCYGEHVISILNPSTEKRKFGGFYVHYCPRCKNEYLMNKVPPINNSHIPRSIRSLY